MEESNLNSILEQIYHVLNELVNSADNSTKIELDYLFELLTNVGCFKED